jgi:hypothetical protein
MASSTLLPLPFHDRVISLLHHLHQLIQQVSHSSIGVSSSKRFAVADTGATDHMLPDKADFILYKSISNLQVQMGNSSFITVLGRGTAVISLNGQRVLIRNALHLPGLVVPHYSLGAPHPTWLRILWRIQGWDACLFPDLCDHCQHVVQL